VVVAITKEPIVSYETDKDGNTFQITEYDIRDKYILSDEWEDPNFTQIPNQLLGSWEKDKNGEAVFIHGMMSDMSESELKVCLVLCRLTYGFHRDRAKASISFIQDATGMSRQGVLNGIDRLASRGVFTKVSKPGIETNWERNDVVPATSQRSRPALVNEVDRTSQRSRPNKESINKEEIKLPQPSVAGTADLEEPQYVDLEEEIKKPKWARPETMEQQGMLSITNRKWFQPREKSKTKAILKALNVGAMLGNDVYGECIRQIGDKEQLDFATLPPLPNSWLEWRKEHAKRNRWSYAGLLNALIDRDQLVKHCQYMLREMGASENIPKVEIENGVRLVTLIHDPSQGPMPKYAGPEEGRIEV
jgi:hypothetical protein